MKTTKITIKRNVPVLDKNGKKTKDLVTGYNVTEEIKFKGTQIEFNNGLILIPDYGKHEKCKVKTACKLSGVYTKLIKNNLKALKMNYCYSADGYKGAYFGTKNTNLDELTSFLQSVKVEKDYIKKIEKIDAKRKADNKVLKSKKGISKVATIGDAITEQNENAEKLAVKVEIIETSTLFDDNQKRELIADLMKQF